MRLLFPHISRFFSAAVLWSLFLALVGANIFSLANYPLAYGDKLALIYTRPYSSESHVSFALDLWSNGARQSATDEMNLARELGSYELDGSDVLGTTSDPESLLASWQNEPVHQQARERMWEEILSMYPDYRDGYIALAQLLYQDGNTEQAREYIARAAVLDPNNPQIHTLATFVAAQ